MGSSGSGRLTDYPGSSSKPKPSGGGGGGGGDEPPEDRCARAINARLEDVEQSEYHQAHGSPPPVGTTLQVVRTRRLVAQTADGLSVGNLPTAFNYLASCIESGWSYVGTIRDVTNGPPVASIAADFVASGRQ